MIVWRRRDRGARRAHAFADHAATEPICGDHIGNARFGIVGAFGEPVATLRNPLTGATKPDSGAWCSYCEGRVIGIALAKAARQTTRTAESPT